jgi:hypothetical protein
VRSKPGIRRTYHRHDGAVSADCPMEPESIVAPR